MTQVQTTIVNVRPAETCFSFREILPANCDPEVLMEHALKNGIDLYVFQEHFEQIKFVCEFFRNYKGNNHSDYDEIDIWRDFCHEDEHHNTIYVTKSLIVVNTTHLTIPKELFDRCVALHITDPVERCQVMASTLGSSYSIEIIDAMIGNEMCLNTEIHLRDATFDEVASFIHRQVDERYTDNTLYFINIESAVQDGDNVVVEFITKEPVYSTQYALFPSELSYPNYIPDELDIIMGYLPKAINNYVH